MRQSRSWYALCTALCCTAAAAFQIGFAASASVEATPPFPETAPGIYTTPTPGIASIRGECTGNIALTPFVPYYRGEGSGYALVYHCASKTFEVLKTQTDLIGIGGLTLESEGYYLQMSKVVNRVWQGGYFFYDRTGREVRELTISGPPKVHDLILGNDRITYLKYVDRWNEASCIDGAPLELEIITENFAGKVLWHWSSQGHIDPANNVSTAASMHAAPIGILRAIRNCYTSLARRLVDFDVPKWPLWKDKYAFLDIEEDDYVHVNSVQRLEPSGDILISARHQDTIFLIDKATGRLKWSLGGPFSKATKTRPTGDPRGGFSHPHYARIFEGKLWVLDNGNLFPDMPSRAAAYQLDSTPPNRMVFQFLEPNGRQRYALGSVQPLDDGHLLIGWGAVNPEDLGVPQRAISIVDLADGKETFALDLKPGWISYSVQQSPQDLWLESRSTLQ